MKHFFPDSFGVDHKVAKQKVRLVCLDLSDTKNQQLVAEWCTDDHCLWVHFGVPCGTASAARFRRMGRRHHGPPPLRSYKLPDGLPGLSGPNLARLRAANRLYSFMAQLILQLDAKNITWTVENPWTSLMWLTSYWKKVESHRMPFYCELHNCMFGGKRLKRTCIASNNSAVLALNILCDQQHEHEPWSVRNNVFDTSLEAEYTPQLAKCLATTMLEAICGDVHVHQVQRHAKKLKLSHFSSIAADKQPSKPLGLPLVAEFSHIVMLSQVSSSLPIQVLDSVTSQCCILQLHDQEIKLPCGSKLLRKTLQKGGDNRLTRIVVDRAPGLHEVSDVGTERHKLLEVAQFQCSKAGKCCEYLQVLDVSDKSTNQADWVFGVRWSPEDFVEQACMLRHPFESFSGLSIELKSACEFVASRRIEEVINLRCSKLGSWLKKAAELKEEEELLKEGMPPTRRRILQKKRLLLMKHIIQTEGYGDESLADDLSAGFELVGTVPRSGVLPAKMVPASLSTDSLLAQSAKANKALRFMTKSCGDGELDVKLWDKTNLEVERGWLAGPLDWSSLPESATVSRRFPLSQTDKVRPIDDLSQSQVNSTVTSFEQATVDGPDVICALALFLMKQLADNGRETELVGRSLDLASAYRQLPISDHSLKFSFLSIFNPLERTAALFQQIALPFGSRTAVNAFIRCARFLQWVAAVCLKLPTSCYFDDFVTFTTPGLAGNSQSVLCLMLDILGWGFDREGPKSDDFSDRVAALGVVFLLDKSLQGILVVTNTDRRIREGVEFLERILQQRKLQKKDALVLRGRLSFCDAFIFGRLGKIALQNITKHAYAKPFSLEIDAALEHSLIMLKMRLLNGKPRFFDMNVFKNFYLFTDASFDPAKGAGLGGVLFDSDGNVLQWYGIEMDLQDLVLFLDENRKTVIGELETLVVAVALLIWSRRMHSSRLMAFIDNEGAKFSLIKGYSKSPAITAICALVATFLDVHFILPWYCRVPSPSNVADFPSRFTPHFLLTPELQVPKGEVQSSLKECLEFLQEAKTPQGTWVGAVAKAGGVNFPPSDN